MSYTTTKGNTHEVMTSKLWRGIKRAAMNRFDGSQGLFNACWRQYRGYINGSIDDPQDIDDVMSWLDSIASEKVNNSNSRFYIYG